MQYQLDERGWVTNLQLTPKEVKVRGWLYGDLNHVPAWARDEVRKHRDAYERAMHREELKQRYGADHERMAALRANRQCSLWNEVVLRQPQVSNVDSN